MSRPKGSKNRKTVVETSAELSDQLAAKQKEAETINDAIDALKNQIAEKRKEASVIKKEIARLTVRFKEAEAAEKEAEKQRLLQTVVKKLMDSGLESEAIISKLEA